MRACRRLALSAAALAVMSSSAAAQAPARQASPPPLPDPRDQVRTSDQVKQGSVQGAATTPLRDLNVMKVEIPDILLEAARDPYKRPPRNWRCATLVGLLRPLEAALGPDLDQPADDDRDLTDRGKSTALSVAGDLAGSAIPFRGVVRRLSGAASHDRRVQEAILAGSVRRAYLKGLGEARGCPAPAAPTHVLTAMARSPETATTTDARSKPPSRDAAPKTPDGRPPAGLPKSRP
jgi:hypothetical protein